MLGSQRGSKLAMAALAAATLLLGMSSSQAQPATTGSVRMQIVKAGLIVGVGGGSGTLVFRGKRYPLSISGIGLGSLGIASVVLVGTAENLTDPRAIEGTYTGAGAGGTFVGGAQVATLQNGNGVVMRLHGAQAGFQVSLSLGGMTVRLK